MSDEEYPVEFENEQLPKFLDHIAREEAQELERLRREYDAAAREVRAGARRESRQYHHRACDEARARIESAHTRRLSRARSQSRRRRWEALQDLRSRARDKIWNHLRARWRSPEQQLSWCRYWLTQCEKLDDCGEIEITLGNGTHESTFQAIRQWIAEDNRAASVKVDESMDEGIVIHYGERSIDGLLQTQLEYLLESIHREIAGWLHDTGGGGEAQT